MKKKVNEKFDYNESKIELFIKGIIVGLSNLIPGISAGTIAITIGIYEKLLRAVNTVRYNFKKSMSFLLPIGIGMIIGLLGFSNVISFALSKYPLATRMLFVGLIVGSIPMLYKEIKDKKEFSDIAIFIVSLGFIILLAVVNANTPLVDLSSVDFIGIIKLLVVGIIAAFTMVIPGISGSLVLVLLGYFEPIVAILKDLSHGGSIVHDVLVLMPFGIGVICGIVLAFRIIDYLLEHQKVKTYYGILGFVIGSIITILISLNYATSLGEYLLGAGLFIFGYLGARKLSENR